MQVLGKNGVLVLTSITGGIGMLEVPADRINLEFVLGNKVMVGSVNALARYTSMVGTGMARQGGGPGWSAATPKYHRRHGLNSYRNFFEWLSHRTGLLRFCEKTNNTM